MKKFIVIITCLLAMACTDHKNDKPGDEFIGNWTDGTWRHFSIVATKGGYIVTDISEGHKKFFATYEQEINGLAVQTPKKLSIFNYVKASDEIVAGIANFHREK
ncbi:MAG TPA: hypothetical protein VGI43_06020 [Mucilaginibacter sp.]|jgi:hypothetical protein